MNRRDALKLLSSVIILPKLVGPTPVAAEAHSTDVLATQPLEPTVTVKIWGNFSPIEAEHTHEAALADLQAWGPPRSHTKLTHRHGEQPL